MEGILSGNSFHRLLVSSVGHAEPGANLSPHCAMSGSEIQAYRNIHWAEVLFNNGLRVVAHGRRVQGQTVHGGTQPNCPESQASWDPDLVPFSTVSLTLLRRKTYQSPDNVSRKHD